MADLKTNVNAVWDGGAEGNDTPIKEVKNVLMLH